jgi:hypothetical protein
MKRYIFLLLFVLIPSFAFGATFYFDTTCTDTNPASGTPDGTNYDPTGPSCSGGSDSYYVTLADFNVTNWGTSAEILFRRGQTWSGALKPFIDLSECTFDNSDHKIMIQIKR